VFFSSQNYDKVGELGSKGRYQLVNIFQDVEEICKNDVLRLLSFASEYTVKPGLYESQGTAEKHSDNSDSRTSQTFNV